MPLVCDTTREGSSPHTRGALRSRRRPVSPRRDHPRIRGEHVVFSLDPHFRIGSSPHTRGAPVLLGIPAPPVGIIPAYAGSTPCGTIFREDHWDHPRIRGEHTRSHAQRGWGGGSSPHTRGALSADPAATCRMRIIPAYAGSTSLPQARGAFSWDHPRIRGEHRSPPPSGSGCLGSSPHTRGALLLDVVAGRNVGIIPAYAGSTSGGRGCACVSPDHPRIRGEHTWKSLQYQGSPP